MVGMVLTGNGITHCEKGTYALVGGDELSDTERDQLLEFCRQRLDALSDHAGQRLREIPGAHPRQGPLRVLRRPRTQAVPTASATCRRSASAAVPASDPLREVGFVFCALEGSGRVLLENELALCIADAYPVIKGQAMSFQSCTPRAMGSCQVQR